MKTPKLKSRRMWVDLNAFGGPYAFTAFNENGRPHPKGKPSPFSAQVAVIPLDDSDALLDRAYDALLNGSGITMRDGIRDALVAIGVLPKARKGRK